MSKQETIYRCAGGRDTVLALYDAQLEKLGAPFRDIYVDTRFGKTHVVETGNMEGKPLLLLHGGNATTAYNLLSFQFLFADFHIYAADIIGHPGKSAEVCLSPQSDDYGFWLGDVISALGFNAMRCCAGSFGAGVLAKAIRAVPEKIEKAVLIVPSGIRNAAAGSMKMIPPLLMYRATHKEKYLVQCILPMAVTEDNIDADTLETVRRTLDHVRIKAGMPGNIRLKEPSAVPALVMAAERDCLFPAKHVLPQAQRLFSQCRAYTLEGRGHMCALTEDEKRMICAFIR